MERRGFLARAVGASAGIATLVGSSGCVERIGAGTPSIDERDRPDRPNSLTESSVIEYVAEFEAARTHNAHVEAGVTDVDLTTTATLDYVIGDAYHVTTQHAGTVRRDGNGVRSVEEIRSRPIPYRVTDDETLRLPVDRERVGAAGSNGSDDDGTDGDDAIDGSGGVDGDDEAGEDDGSGGGDETAGAPLGIRLCNALDRPREVDIEVHRYEPADAVPALPDEGTPLEGTWTVDAHEAVELREVTTEPGTYRVIARVSENGLTGEGRIDVDLPGVDRGANADVLSSANGLSTRSLPPFDPI